MERASLVSFMCSTSSSYDSVNEYLRQLFFNCSWFVLPWSVLRRRCQTVRIFTVLPPVVLIAQIWTGLSGYFIHDIGNSCVMWNGCPALWISSSRQHRCNTCGGYLPCLFIHECVLWESTASL